MYSFLACRLAASCPVEKLNYLTRLRADRSPHPRESVDSRPERCEGPQELLPRSGRPV